jgi:excisionase family DNA binding protein
MSASVPSIWKGARKSLARAGLPAAFAAPPGDRPSLLVLMASLLAEDVPLPPERSHALARVSNRRIQMDCLAVTPPDARRPDDLLKPREVAELFGVRTTTIARWNRMGRLTATRTLGGHRRYARDEIYRVLSEMVQPDEVRHQLEEDAVRLYDQGWSIRQVAEKFNCSYGMMRRILKRRTVLRPQGGAVRGTNK